jgi:uncharacterized membrane protein YGL010W
MKTLTDQLSNYATYHRDRRNIATHFVGIPMIVLGVLTLLGRPALVVAGLPITPALVAFVGGVGFYLALDVRFGLLMAAIMAAALACAMRFAAMATVPWLAIGAGLFVIGWVIQFVGHIFEGKKPAFVDDLVGLLVGPLFVVAEVVFALGLRSDVRDEVERRAGPVRGARVEADVKG